VDKIGGETMQKLTAFCITVLIVGSYALSQDQPSAAEKAPLLLVQEIPLPNVRGRIDHFTFMCIHARCFRRASSIEVDSYEIL